MFYTVYKIKNIVNNMEYIGIHSTKNINDKYMGSGVALKIAQKKYGMDSFEKTILFVFDNKEDMIAKEKELVNLDYILSEDTYNSILGGDGYVDGMTPVKDANDNIFYVSTTDPRYISGELVHCTKGLVTVRDKDNNHMSVSINDERYLSGELTHNLTGYFTVECKYGKTYSVNKNDPRYLSGELTSIHKNKITVKDKNGKTYSVTKDDPRYISGELVHCTKGFTSVRDKDNNVFRVSINDPRYLSGELVNIQKGKKVMHHPIDKINKVVIPTLFDEYYSNGWVMGKYTGD